MSLKRGRRRVSYTIGSSLVCLLALAASATNSEGTVAQSADARVILATVVDGSGRGQVDFGLDDFVVNEGGREREVIDVHVADYPVVVLIDASNASALPAIKHAANRFITRIGARPVIAASLSSAASEPGSLPSNFDADREHVLASVDAVVPGTSDAATNDSTPAKRKCTMENG